VKKIRKRHGFSLTELLAVIIVIGIVIVIALPVINGVVGTVKTNFYQNQENSLLFSGKDYFTDANERLPRTLGETQDVTLKTLIDEGYTKSIVDAEKEVCDIDESKVEVTNLSKGEYGYTVRLVCNNYDTVLAYGPWSEWQTTMPTGQDIEIETEELYNIQNATTFYTNWTDWTDVAMNDDGIRNVEDVVTNTETENRTLYQYQDQQWKWYTGGTSYASGYYLSAPGGYPTIDSGQCQTWYKWYTGGTSYASGYYLSAPGGYPTRDTGQCTTWYEYYYTSIAGTNKWNYTPKTSCPGNSYWAFNSYDISSSCAGKESRTLYCDTRNICWYDYSGSNGCTVNGVGTCTGKTMWRGYNHGAASCLSSAPSWSYVPSDLSAYIVSSSQCESTYTQYNYSGSYTAGATGSYTTPDYNRSAQACKYYTNTTTYYGSYAYTAPSGYPTQDWGQSTSACKYYTNTQVYYGSYASTAPVGYPTKDAGQTQYTAFSAWDTAVPTAQTYRTINNKNQTRTRQQIKSWSGNLLTKAVTKSELEATMGKTLEQIELDPLNRYTKTTMYRYRIKLK
jgi:type IV pilus assembly protein PilA